MIKAARLHAVGGGDGLQKVFRVDELPIPDVTASEVLVRVLRAGLNRGDVDLREEVRQYGRDGRPIPTLPITIGHDGMGEVAEVGQGVENVRVGDRVVVICAVACGFCKYCRTDRDNICESRRTMGFPTGFREWPTRLRRYKDGLWAEYCRVPAANVVRLEPNADIDAACKVSQIAVAYRGLKRARLRPGEIVLVNGASGIAGIGAVLSSLALGAQHVIAVARNPARLERVKAINPGRVSPVALQRGDSIAGRVKEITEGQGANVLVDLSPLGGTRTALECMRNLERGGRIILAGSYSEEPINLSLDYLQRRHFEVMSVNGRSSLDVEEVLGLVWSGFIDTRHITTRYFPLEAANEALDFIEQRRENDALWPMYAANG
jgi:threonine dehydrogenase-like Zn-dependent dehydrogenase